jgi:molybdopterin-containing oxidoreductase family iron-sulfur binding subunit
MEITRRTFLQTAGATAVAASIGGCASEGASSKTAVRWGMVIDLQRCVGCLSCTVACRAENHTPPGVAYNVVMEEEVGAYPYVRRTFLSRPCMQCRKSACTLVCPTQATSHREDGIVIVNYNRCIGCRYCIAACPYGARSFDYGHNYHDSPTPYEEQASPEYGENRKRRAQRSPVGNVRKCTFCLHRIAKGLNPACAETCLGGAIHFGDLNDTEGRCRVHGEKLQELLATRAHMRLKEELGNEPSVYYLT